MSVIAHDLKNPFNSILGFSAILAENPDQFDSEKISEMCRLIYQQAQSAHNLLENMLQWAKTQRLSLPEGKTYGYAIVARQSGIIIPGLGAERWCIDQDHGCMVFVKYVFGYQG